MTLAWSPCFSAPDLKWEREKQSNTAWCVHYNIMATTGNTETAPLFSSTQKPCPWHSHLKFPWTRILSTFVAHCKYHFTKHSSSCTAWCDLSLLNFQNPISSPLVAFITFYPALIMYAHDPSVSCWLSLSIDISALFHLLPPHTQCLKQWLPEGQQVFTTRNLLGEPSS